MSHRIVLGLALGILTAAPAWAQEAGTTSSGASSTRTFASMMNPGISVSGLFLAGVESQDGKLVAPGQNATDTPLPGKGETFGTGPSVQEIEVQFSAAVDPYFKANVVMSIPGTEGVEIEEGYATLTAVPRLLVNVGKVKEPFGRENMTHTHALLTLDKSLVGQRVLGAEGLNDVAIDAALLMPTPWYSEVTLGVDAGQNDLLYGSGKPLGLGNFAHLKNLFDLSENYTLEVGLSGATGETAFDSRSWTGGADVTIRGHGSGRHMWNRLIWQNEFMYSSRPGSDTDPRVGGAYSTLRYSVTRRLWLGGRYDWVGLGVDPVQAGSLIAIVQPTEFSAIRLQAQRQFLPGGHTDDSIVAQLRFVLGSHPAHSY